MIFLEDETIPAPLYKALVESNSAYYEEVKEFLDSRSQEVNISVTSLSTPPRAMLLRQRHSKEIYIDPAKDCWHSFMGSVIHYVLERYAADDPDYYAEIREGVTLDVDGVKVLIHGKFDLYHIPTRTLQDWKLTNPSGMIFDKADHHWQLNINKYILESKGHKCDRLQNVYLFPHLDKTKFNDPNYPQRNQKVVDSPIFKRKDVEEYIKDRIRRVIKNRKASDTKLDFCTDHERWVRGSNFAVYLRKKQAKKGEVADFSSRAAARFQAKHEAVVYLEQEGIQLTDALIREFKGEPKKCGFCEAAPFCNQYQAEQLQLRKQANDSIF